MTRKLHIENHKELGKIFIHYHGEKLENCNICGNIASFLCDFPVGNDKTCDCKLCNECAEHIGVNLHYCPDHFKIWEDFKNRPDFEEKVTNIINFEDISK